MVGILTAGSVQRGRQVDLGCVWGELWVKRLLACADGRSGPQPGAGLWAGPLRAGGKGGRRSAQTTPLSVAPTGLFACVRVHVFAHMREAAWVGTYTCTCVSGGVGCVRVNTVLCIV